MAKICSWTGSGRELYKGVFGTCNGDLFKDLETAKSNLCTGEIAIFGFTEENKTSNSYLIKHY